MAPIVPLDVDDGRGGRHALLWDRRTGTLSAVLRCSPIGVDLADPGQVDAWIAGWAALLADLGYQPLVTHIAVTVDTSPTGGATVRDHVAAALDPHAPALARRVLEELVAVTPAAAAEVDARLTVTLDPRRAQPKPPDLLAAVVDVGRWLPGIETALAGCGVAVLGRASTGWLTGRIRAAFDPAARPDLTHLDLAQPRRRHEQNLLRCWSGRRPGRSPRSSTGTPTGMTRGCRCPGRCGRRPGRPWPPGCWPRCSPPGRSPAG